jgi:hypothetical protein
LKSARVSSIGARVLLTPDEFVRNTFFGLLSSGAIALAGFVGGLASARLLGRWSTVADMGIGTVKPRFIPNLRAPGRTVGAKASSMRV